MANVTIALADEQEFFASGKHTARLADAGQALTRRRTISFEDAADLLKILSAARLELLKAVKSQPDSIAGIAQRLGRDRSAVKRDIDQLAMSGLLTLEDQTLPGHGRMRWVKPAASRFKLQALLG